MIATYDDDVARWLVCMAPDGQIYAYLQETNQFHYSYPLDMDHRWDRDFTYTTISPTAAAQLINEGIGMPDGLREGALKRLISSGASISVEETLGEAAAAIVRDVE